jgi:hypothetical protein
MEILHRAHLSKPAQVALALLSELGFHGAPDKLARAPDGVFGREYARILAETRAFYTGEEGVFAAMRREFLLGGGLSVALRRNRRRLAGLIRPSRGIPA